MKKIIPTDAVVIPDTAQRVFEGKIFDVYQWPQELFDGSNSIFEMLKRPDTVVVVGLTPDGVIVLDDEQPHFGSRKSFPGGRVDTTDASVESAAQREMQEETGYSFKNWRLIKVVQPYLKIEWFVYLFVAWEVDGQSEAHLDAGEKIKVEVVSFDNLRELVLDKQGYLGEGLPAFESVEDLQGLTELPEFVGQEVDR
ncbi:MAG TPA: NUDIX hydrolase [Candidatus Saccharimonadales bacterium]|nr:NUDIX hydrolase [Candidatus Saccharimonadales bacterium]